MPIVQFNFIDSISPICLPLDGSFSASRFVGDNAFVAGWGYVSARRDETSILMELQVPGIQSNFTK